MDETQRYFELCLSIINGEDDFWGGLESWNEMIARYNFVPPNPHFSFRLRSCCYYLRACLDQKVTVTVHDVHRLGFSKIHRIWRLYELTDKPEYLEPTQYYKQTNKALEDKLKKLTPDAALDHLDKRIKEAVKKVQDLIRERQEMINAPT